MSEASTVWLVVTCFQISWPSLLSSTREKRNPLHQRRELCFCLPDWACFCEAWSAQVFHHKDSSDEATVQSCESLETTLGRHVCWGDAFWQFWPSRRKTKKKFRFPTSNPHQLIHVNKMSLFGSMLVWRFIRFCELLGLVSPPLALLAFNELGHFCWCQFGLPLTLGFAALVILFSSYARALGPFGPWAALFDRPALVELGACRRRHRIRGCWNRRQRVEE